MRNLIRTTIVSLSLLAPVVAAADDTYNKDTTATQDVKSAAHKTTTKTKATVRHAARTTKRQARKAKNTTKTKATRTREKIQNTTDTNKPTTTHDTYNK